MGFMIGIGHEMSSSFSIFCMEDFSLAEAFELGAGGGRCPHRRSGGAS